MTQQLVLALVLAGLQVLVIRVAQYALPQLYFTTSSLFERRSEVKAGAILFRLSIPLIAGMLVPLLISDNKRAVAAAAGAICWFLVLWPIVWAPSLLFPHAKAWPIVGLLLAFWAAYTLFPIAGVSITEIAQGVARNGDLKWGSLFLEAILTTIPISTATWLLSRLVDQRVTFADDDFLDDEVPDTEIEELDSYTPSLRERFESASAAVPEGLVSLATLVVLLLIVLRGRRNGRS